MSNSDEITTFHLKEKPKQFIDKLVMKGYYMSRAEFIRIAIDQKIEKIIDQLQDPFFQEIVIDEQEKQEANKRVSIRGL
ncbi:MAG: ribbon-helix-helix domain-containing protein [Candidatus Heimdallarchaeaceae archaeon]